MRRFVILAVAAAVVATGSSTLSIPSAHAQDDWGVDRDPFDRRVVNRYKAILRRNPGDQAALRKLTRLYKRYRTFALLVKEYETQVEAKPKAFAERVVLGHLYLDAGRTDDALRLYEQAAALRPKAAAVQVALGDLYRTSGAPAKARAAYDKALAASKNKNQKKQILRSLADIALAADDIDAAKGYYEKYIELDPRNVDARVQLGDALLRYDKHADAIAAYKEAEKRLRSDPARRVEVVSRLGRAYEAGGDEEAAIREYRRAIGMVKRTYYLRKELTERIVDIYRRRQDLASLITHYEKDWPAARRGHFEWDVLARLYEETGDQEHAIDAYQKATRKAPFELDTQRRLIALLENSGREDEALRQYETVIRVAPGEPRFQLELAARYWQRGKQKKALALLQRMERRFPGDGSVHAAIADLYTRWGKEDLALEAFVRLTRIEPDDINHLVNLGEQYFQRNQRKKAEQVWRRIISRRTAKNFARLGEVYAEHDMQPKALEMYSKAIQLEKKNPDFYKGRAGVYTRQRNYVSAVGDWEKVLELTPDKAANKPQRREARRNIVHLLKRSRRLDRAIARWRTAFANDKPDIEAGYFLVEAFLRQGPSKVDDARRTLEQILALVPDDIEAIQQLVKVYKRTMQYDKAVKLLLKLIELSPGREREYYTQIAEIMTDDRQDDKAIFYAQKALEKSPNDPIAHMRLAERYEDMQQFDKAITAYEKTVELDPRNFKAHFALARLYKFSDQPTKAAELYRAVFKRATDNEILRRAGREAVDIEEMNGTLGGLERVVSPLAFTFAHKDIYRRILVELYERYVPRLVDLKRRGTTAERKAATEELERLGSHGLKPLLEALNDDKDPAQQRIAVSVLGHLGNKGAAAPLVRLAKQAKTPQPARRIGTLVPTLDWDVHVEALVAAGRLGDPRTIPDLVELAGHRELAMREAAVFALGRTGDAKALPALHAALADRRESAQTLACLGLAQVGENHRDKSSVTRMIDVVTDSRQHQSARAACAFALGYLGEASAVEPLIGVLARGNGDLQRVAAWALGRLGDKRAVPALLGAYFSRHDQVRDAIAWSLTRLGGDRVRERLTDFGEFPMRNGKYHVREAVSALPGALEPGALPADLVIGNEAELTSGLRDALGRHRDMVLRVLDDLDGHRSHLALGPLTRGAASLPKSAQKRLLGTLERIGGALVPELQRLTVHRDPKVRSLALSVLAKIDAAETPGLLAARTADDSVLVRIEAMQAIAAYARIHGKTPGELREAVITRLREDRWQAKRTAAQVLGGLGGADSVEALLAALGDHNAYVREAAAEALGTARDRRTVEPLIDASRDEVGAVRLAAARSLAAIGDRRGRARIAEMASSDPDPDVRAATRRLERKK